MPTTISGGAERVHVVAARQARGPQPIIQARPPKLSRRAVSGRTRGCSCQCAAYKGLDDEGGATSPERSQLVQPSFKYKRVMLKISGEALEGDHEFGIDPKVLQRIAKEVAEVSRSGVEVAIVVGGGNFFRGVNRWTGLDRPTADYVGMLATIMNAITLQSALESEDVETRVQTSIEMREVAEPYIRRRAIRHLERGRVVIFGGGTGNPFFTTDTASALRAAEIGAEVFLKATQVDGIYDSDPKQNRNARRYSHLSYRKCLVDNLAVLDESAFALCKENDIPVVVFNLHKSGNIISAAQGCTTTCTLVDSAPDCPEDCLSSSASLPNSETMTPPASPEVLSMLERSSQAAEEQSV